MGKLAEATDTSLLVSVFTRVVQSGDVCESACIEALAAAEVVAALRHRPGESLPDEVESYVARLDIAPSEELTRLALQAVQRATRESSLSGVWEWSGGWIDDWLAGVTDLEIRLGAVRKAAAPTQIEPKTDRRRRQPGLHQAIYDNNIEEVRRILESDPGAIESRDKDGMTPLLMATRMGRNDIIELLLAHGADVNNKLTKGAPGTTPLMYACSQSTQALVETGDPPRETFVDVTPCSMKVIELLLAHGADVNAKDTEGSTALHSVAISGRIDLAEPLLQHGANVNVGAGTVDGTPLDICLTINEFKPIKPMVEFLLAYGANVHLRNIDGRNPVDAVTSQLQRKPKTDRKPKPELAEILKLLKAFE